MQSLSLARAAESPQAGVEANGHATVTVPGYETLTDGI